MLQTARRLLHSNDVINASAVDSRPATSLEEALSIVAGLMGSDRAELTLQDEVRILDRRKRIVLGTVIPTASISIGLMAFQTPFYSASADVLAKQRGQDGSESPLASVALPSASLVPPQPGADAAT